MPPTYYPRLDGLRALAVFGVFVEHFTYSEAIRAFHPGHIGVRLFFVLSGFLITSILLSYGDRSVRPGEAAREFYWRRFLRLSPALTVAVALSAALGIAGMRSDWWVHLLYLTNFKAALEQHWAGASHFWTLAVEEQFYLLWFAVAVCAPRRLLLPAIIACLVGAPVFRAVLSPSSADFVSTLLPGQIDSLAAGALLSLIWRGASPSLDRLLTRRWLLAASGAAALLLGAPLGWPHWISAGFFPVAINIAAACAVRLSLNVVGPDKGLLSAAPLRHVGRISYGLYVYHYLVPPALYLFFPGLGGLEEGWAKGARVALWIVTTFAIAEISWFLIERPALKLKNVKMPVKAKLSATPMSVDLNS